MSVIIAVPMEYIAAFGARDGIVLQQIVHYSETDLPVTRRHLADFTSFSEKQIQSATGKLAELGVVVPSQPGLARWDRTFEFGIDYEVLNRLVSAFTQTGTSICPNGRVSSAQTGISSSSIDEIDKNPDDVVVDSESMTSAKAICDDLADRVAAHTNLKRKDPSSSGVHAVEKLIRLDEVSPERVSRIVAWIFDDPAGQFWRGNVQSGSKLRVQFGRLVAQANESRAGRAPVVEKQRATTTECWELSASYTDMDGHGFATPTERVIDNEVQWAMTELSGLVEAESKPGVDGRVNVRKYRTTKDQHGATINRDVIEDRSFVVEVKA